jgi:hypothetical protein
MDPMNEALKRKLMELMNSAGESDPNLNQEQQVSIPDSSKFDSSIDVPKVNKKGISYQIQNPRKGN